MTTDLFERYASLDPAKAPGIQPAWRSVSAVSLSAVDGRAPDMQTQQKPPTQPPTPKKQGRTGLLIAAAAFGLVLIVSAVVLLSNGGASDVPTATTPTTTVAADSAPQSSPTPSEAVAVANAWYVAFNAGDVDAVMALLAPDPSLGNNFIGTSTLEEERMRNTWNAAQGTKLVTEGCRPIGDNSEQGQQQVRCIGATYDALVQAVDATPVTTRVTMTVDASGIVALRYSYGSPDFDHVGYPFDKWMAANHPDVENLGFGSWETVEEAEAEGIFTAKWAAEWATYLEANDCTYLDGC